MKSLKVLAVAAVASLAFVGGCNKSTKSDMGAVSGQKCTDKAGCDANAKATCPTTGKKEGAMGAVDAKKADCCGASKTCADKK